MEQTSGISLVPPESRKLNKATIFMACVTVLAIAAAVTFGILWTTKKTAEPAANNSSSATSKQEFSGTSSSELARTMNSFAFSQEKLADTDEDITYGAFYTDEITGENGTIVRATASASGVNTASVTVNWQDLNTYYNANHNLKSSERSENNEVFELTFPKNIADIFIASAGQKLDTEEILFLMEDGTVNFISVKEAAKNNDFKSYQEKSGLTNIVKFYRGTYIPTNDQVGGGTMSYAQDAEQNIYPLYHINR